jgi:transcriptional regulator with XRE-family HTH domain
MHTKESGGKEAPGARRLRILRKAEGGDSSSAWAKRMGMTLPQYSNYENGVPLSKPAAVRLATRVPGLTTDWLFMGRMEGLSVDLRRRLEKAEQELEPPPEEDVLPAEKKGLAK